jgi:hypothetical protein
LVCKPNEWVSTVTVARKLYLGSYLKHFKIKNMKTLLLSFVLCTSISYSQWTSKTVNNGFDEPYRICHSKEVDGAILKLENVNGKVVFYIQGMYVCEDEIVVDISFLINSEYSEYTFVSKASKDHEVLFFTWDLLGSKADEDFQACREAKVRIKDSTCGESIYTFQMSGSTLALKYIQKIP